MTRKFVAAFIVMALAGATAALAAEWKNVPLIDKMCLSKVKADPDAHETSCLLSCSKSGYGILTSDGKWLKFDNMGNEKAMAALKATDKKDHIRVNVTGEMKGTTLQVSDLTIQ